MDKVSELFELNIRQLKEIINATDNAAVKEKAEMLLDNNLREYKLWKMEENRNV